MTQRSPAGEPEDLTASAQESVRVVRYNPQWPARFEEERALLETTIGRWAVGGIHHVGSTAVPGLAAKPVIDILVGVEDLASSRALIPELARSEYRYAPYRTDEMHWFCKPNPGHRTHHLHLVPVDSQRFRDELAFRDRLRADPGAVEEYARLKRRLAIRFEDHREAYTGAKASFIRMVLDRSA